MLKLREPILRFEVLMKGIFETIAKTGDFTFSFMHHVVEKGKHWQAQIF